MTKLIFLVLLLGHGLSYVSVNANPYIRDIRELDNLLLSAAWDVDNPGQLPTTPMGVYHSWCKPLLQKTMRAMDLIEGLFHDNPVLMIFVRLSTSSKLNMATKLCNNQQIVEMVAQFNEMTNRIIPRLMPWYFMTVNTYLAVADPDSHADVGDLICLLKKMVRRLLEVVPPFLKKGIIENLIALYRKDGQLVAGILRHMNVDTNVYVCHLANRAVMNPLGIKSQEMAALLAWDKVLRRYRRYL